MSAEIIDLAAVRTLRGNAGSAVTQKSITAETLEDVFDLERPRFHFWTGASGQRYVHTIHSLLLCPEVPASNYILLRRNADGSQGVLAIGRVSNDAPSLNLAEIRQRGAELGANEVHVHLLATSPRHSKHVAQDLRTAQFGIEHGQITV